ncbi:hypothetical protein C5167_010778 [Papaver somniferum]|uniref:FBD domain-containing protein n=1 Tax=Papaver somniferum TaxID=3469 RepID=A0A4Y7K541_PAPSO|nr:hypothetical protein C5167_010778 [Papaver somniferum]
MSFMDMTYVVQTCVLSKRWKSLWASTPILNFDFNVHSLAISNNNQNSGVPFQKFIKFVDQVFILRDNSNIQSVNLVCGKGTLSLMLLLLHGLSQLVILHLQVSSLTLKHLTVVDLVRKTSSKVKIDAPNLVSFKCEDFISKCYVLENLASLVTAHIHMTATKGDAGKINDYTENHWLFLTALEFRGLRGDFNELKFVQIIFKKAVVLEKMVLFITSKKSEKMDKRLITFREKLPTLPRASSSVATFLI